MKKSLWTSVLALAVAGALTLPALAQGGGGGGGGGGPGGGGFGGGGGGRRGMDPAQMQQMQLDNIKTQLAAKDDEWTVLEPKIKAVLTEQQKLNAGRGRGAFGFGGRGGRGGRGGGGGGPGGGGFGGGAAVDQTNPVAVAYSNLETTVQDTNASPDKLKTDMQALRDARKTVQGALSKAQDSLKEVVTVRQEAVLVTMGLLE